jgi:hypothetical protein
LPLAFIGDGAPKLHHTVAHYNIERSNRCRV